MSRPGQIRDLTARPAVVVVRVLLLNFLMSIETTKGPPVVIWWIMWAAITIGLVAIYATLAAPLRAEPLQALRHLPLLPLLLSSGLRWIVLPRMSDRLRAFPIFIVGLAMAEACGLLGLFLIPEMKQTYFTLSLIGLLQYMPFFAGRYKE